MLTYLDVLWNWFSVFLYLDGQNNWCDDVKKSSLHQRDNIDRNSRCFHQKCPRRSIWRLFPRDFFGMGLAGWNHKYSLLSNSQLWIRWPDRPVQCILVCIGSFCFYISADSELDRFGLEQNIDLHICRFDFWIVGDRLNISLLWFQKTWWTAATKNSPQKQPRQSYSTNKRQRVRVSKQLPQNQRNRRKHKTQWATKNITYGPRQLHGPEDGVSSFHTSKGKHRHSFFQQSNHFVLRRYFPQPGLRSEHNAEKINVWNQSLGQRFTRLVRRFQNSRDKRVEFRDLELKQMKIA